MLESARSLLDDMIVTVDRMPIDEEIILAPEYADRIDAIGKVPFLVEVFRTFADSMLTNWMLRLGFCWKDLSFDEWREVLRQISKDRVLLYQFVWFACKVLAIDITEMIRSDSGIDKLAGARVAQLFPNGGSPPNSVWYREVLEEHGIDQQAMWRRLSAEGAPIFQTIINSF